MSDLIEKLLEDEFRRSEAESANVARKILPLVKRLIGLDEYKVAVLEEMLGIVKQRKEEKIAELAELESKREQSS